MGGWDGWGSRSVVEVGFFNHGEIVRTMMMGRRRRRRECQLVGQVGKDVNDKVEDEGRVKLL